MYRFDFSDAILQINSMTVFKQEAPSPGSTNEITNLQTVRENRQSPTSTQHHQPQQNQQNGTMVAATGCGGMDDNNSQTMFNNTINQLLSQSGLVNLQNVMDGELLFLMGLTLVGELLQAKPDLKRLF